jgi:hypothetical protein
LIPAVLNAGTITGVVGSYHAAIFIPRIWSVTAGPLLDWFTVTVLPTTVTVTVCVAAVPVEGVTVRV